MEREVQVMNGLEEVAVLLGVLVRELVHVCAVVADAAPDVAGRSFPPERMIRRPTCSIDSRMLPLE